MSQNQDTYRCEACGQDFTEPSTYIDDDGQRRFRPHTLQIGIIQSHRYGCHGSRALALTDDEQKACAQKFKDLAQARLRELRTVG